MPRHILYYPPEHWTDMAADAIQACIASCLRGTSRCALMLTGGRSAMQVYAAWVQHLGFKNLAGVDFYFGDERCVPPDHPESNYGMAMRTLFAAGVPESCTVHRMEADSEDLEAAASGYAAALPERIDCLLLGVGEDGHIASLFPHSAALHENQRRVVAVTGPKSLRRRLTVTPPVIRLARSVFVLAAGESKAAVLAEAWRAPEAIDALPARMVLGANWLLA